MHFEVQNFPAVSVALLKRLLGLHFLSQQQRAAAAAAPTLFFAGLQYTN